MKYSTIIKLGLSFLLTSIILMGIIFGYIWIKSYMGVVEKKTELLTKSIVAVNIQENNRLLNNRIKELEEVIKNKDGKINDIGKSIAELKVVISKNKKSDHIYKEDTGDANEQYFKMIYSKDTDGNEYPLAWAIFKYKDKKFTTGIVPEWELNSQIVLTEGKENEAIFETWFENNSRKETKGKKYPLKLNSVEWIRREIKNKSFMMNLRLSLSGIITMEDIYPVLDLSLFSYGKTKIDMDWKFISFGIGGSNNLKFDFTPVEWNVGKILPLINNLFIGPTIETDMYFDYTFGIKGAVPF